MSRRATGPSSVDSSKRCSFEAIATSSVSAWEEFVQLTLRKANERRGRRVADELAAMRPLVVARLAEFTEEDVTVSEWSTIRIRHNSYSVPSRLIEQTVRVRLFEDRIEVWFADKLQLSCERLRGRNQRRVDYRHIIWSLIRKPGGFAQYVYRDEMFPSLVFRRAYDAIQTPHHGTKVTSSICGSSISQRAP